MGFWVGCRVKIERHVLLLKVATNATRWHSKLVPPSSGDFGKGQA